MALKITLPYVFKGRASDFWRQSAQRLADYGCLKTGSYQINVMKLSRCGGCQTFF